MVNIEQVYIMKSLPNVIDYFEQFPLWDIELAVRIAHEMNIRYPMDKGGGSLCDVYGSTLSRI